MDPSQPASSSPRPKRVHVGIVIAVLALVVVMIVGISTASRKAATKPRFVWLDQAQFARQMRPGRLKALYYKALHLSAPLWQRFQRPKTQIAIATKIYAVHGIKTEQLDLGTPTGTNDARTEVWILSPSQLKELRQRVKSLNGIDLVNAPIVVTLDGMSASVASGQSLPLTGTFVGVTLGISPKIASHEVQLGLGAVYSEVEQNKGSSAIRTNLCAACRVRLPNAGGLLMKGANSRDNNATNYWLLLCPTAIDAAGNAIKL